MQLDIERFRAVFWRLAGLLLLVLYPILHADRPYNDDLKRALLGRASWDSNGRPLTTLLMRALQAYDHTMVDIAPLPQIGAALLLAWIGARVAVRYTRASPWLAALLVFPLGAQPFFLENLSYRFDALSMALAVLLAAWPLLLPDGRRPWQRGVLCLFAALCLYQPATNVFLVLALLEAWQLQDRDRSPAVWLRQLGLRALQWLVAMVVYELLVGMHISGWVRRQATPIQGLHELPLLGHNFVLFYGFAADAFNAHWWSVFLPVLVALALAPVAIGLRHARGRPPLATVALGLAALAMPLAVMVAALGPMLVLREPEIRPRVLIGLGALLVAGLIALHELLAGWRRGSRVSAVLAGVLAAAMLVVASVYGNATAAQQRMERHVAALLADDLSVLASGHSIVALHVSGSTGFAPLAEHAAVEFPLLRTLVPGYLTDADLFGTSGFLMDYLPHWVDARKPDSIRTRPEEAAALARCMATPLRQAAGYRLCLDGDVARVEFLPAALPSRAQRR
ncbi:glucosyltransferase domain-containing protein [Dyella ginsengisoli]|uniref:glucosyltransferase domain-containing protein n=1 Tax=Dyella ginsengisoli TaxID=363848 RepID=UPI0012FE33AB|nr:glucosyltransferase domain-containing protein [Dyella ginsengisoli]